MITITQEQFLQMSLIERDFVRTLVSGGLASQIDEQQAMRDHIMAHFEKEKEEQENAKKLEATFV